jgi:hypothetical protein
MLLSGVAKGCHIAIKFKAFSHITSGIYFNFLKLSLNKNHTAVLFSAVEEGSSPEPTQKISQ